MLSPYYEESINTVKAGWFTLACAALFGKKEVAHDGLYSVTIAHWRGRGYLMDFKPTSETAG